MYNRQAPRSPYQCFIETDKHAYYPGDRVGCKVILTFDRKFACENVVALFTGVASVQWTDKKALGPSHVGQSYSQRRVLFEESKTIWSASSGKPRGSSLSSIIHYSNSNRMRSQTVSHNYYDENMPEFRGLDKGRHSLPVSFVIPKEGIYSSIEVDEHLISVRYQIEILMGGLSVKKFNRVLYVVSPRDLNLEREELERPASSGRIIDCKTGQLSAVLSLPKTGFTPGESLGAEVTVHNMTSESVKFASVYIVKDITAISNKPRVEIKEREDETNGSILPFPKILRGEKKEWQAQINVPALTPTMTMQDFMHVNYLAKFSVGFERGNRKAAVLHVSIPITIGTVAIGDDCEKSSANEKMPLPDQPASSGHSQVTSGLNAQFNPLLPPPESLPSAPPLYEEVVGGCPAYSTIDDRPMPYSES